MQSWHSFFFFLIKKKPVLHMLLQDVSDNPSSNGTAVVAKHETSKSPEVLEPLHTHSCMNRDLHQCCLPLVQHPRLGLGLLACCFVYQGHQACDLACHLTALCVELHWCSCGGWWVKWRKEWRKERRKERTKRKGERGKEWYQGWWELADHQRQQFDLSAWWQLQPCEKDHWQYLILST